MQIWTVCKSPPPPPKSLGSVRKATNWKHKKIQTHEVLKLSQFQQETLQLWIFPGWTSLAKSPAPRGNETPRPVEWSRLLTRVIILAGFLIDLSHGVFTPRCDPGAPWATGSWTVAGRIPSRESGGKLFLIRSECAALLRPNIQQRKKRLITPELE